MLVGGVAAALLGATLLPAPPAQAALVQFPCAELNNKYILIRAGESYSESQDTILTNPAWKTSMAAGLSEKGKAQVRHTGSVDPNKPHTRMASTACMHM
jgi:hypothetical protein